ncbi:MAG: hypothetical protein RMJ33_05525 [Saprospiraceae bacterium]|nr:hypothetical protein [Saprospiraceae bacterium]MDW8229279.1 hypothetical protein [Saprospiraceae bacterium]
MKSSTLALLFSLISAAFSFAQTSATPSFPADWAGAWSGTLHIYGPKGLMNSVQMHLEIHPIDTSKEGRYAFGIVYGSKEQDWRPYELVPVAPERGLWKVDEKNSIVIEGFHYGPKFISHFTVMNSRLMCTYEKQDAETLLFEVYSGTDKPMSTTGNTEHAGEKIPEVNTYPLSVFQRAVLKKQP